MLYQFTEWRNKVNKPKVQDLQQCADAEPVSAVYRGELAVLWRRYADTALCRASRQSTGVCRWWRVASLCVALVLTCYRE